MSNEPPAKRHKPSKIFEGTISNEIWAMIFTHLDSLSLSRVSQVCTTWAALAGISPLHLASLFEVIYLFFAYNYCYSLHTNITIILTIVMSINYDVFKYGMKYNIMLFKFHEFHSQEILFIRRPLF